MPAAEHPRGIFVTGTDTGVGKTAVAAAIARYLKNLGLRVGVMKPVETGIESPAACGRDGRLLCQAAGISEPPETVSPYRLRAPLAPDQAAELEGIRINPQVIADLAQRQSKAHDFLIVEGAGGLMVPLVGGYLMADLVRQLRLPLLVVAGCSLGTINHTLLTTFTARSLDLPLAGILLNRMPATPDKAQENAPHAIASLASCSLLGVLPAVNGDDEEIISGLADHLGSMETRPWLHTALGLAP